MPDRSRLLSEVERLRVIVALQYLHSKHGFAGYQRTDLDELWKGAHVTALHYGGSGDPAALVSIYLTQALQTHQQIVRDLRGAPPPDVLRLLRERGLGNVYKLRSTLEAFKRAGGDRPADGWGVPYVPWRNGQKGQPRTVKIGGTPQQLARKVEAARSLSPGQIGEMSPAELLILSRGLGLDLPVALDYRQREQVARQISQALQAATTAAAAATPTTP